MIEAISISQGAVIRLKSQIVFPVFSEKQNQEATNRSIEQTRSNMFLS
jgi:hypothetical protein